jgi:adenine/guanine phosphoribosyltransferase-like PRPP-binding protein
MGLSRLVDLVSQAEKEGITLAAMLSREMSSEEMELLQDELVMHLSENYAKIENYMTGVSVPSMEEVLARNDEDLPEIDLGVLGALSDAEEANE